MRDGNRSEIRWRKAARSASDGQCIEVAEAGTAILIRDSKNTNGPILEFTAAEWNAFVEAVKLGEFDRLDG